MGFLVLNVSFWAILVRVLFCCAFCGLCFLIGYLFTFECLLFVFVLFGRFTFVVVVVLWLWGAGVGPHFTVKALPKTRGPRLSGEEGPRRRAAPAPPSRPSDPTPTRRLPFSAREPLPVFSLEPHPCARASDVPPPPRPLDASGEPPPRRALRCRCKG